MSICIINIINMIDHSLMISLLINIMITYNIKMNFLIYCNND